LRRVERLAVVPLGFADKALSGEAKPLSNLDKTAHEPVTHMGKRLYLGSW
jgi:hypothetical protein